MYKTFKKFFLAGALALAFIGTVAAESAGSSQTSGWSSSQISYPTQPEKNWGEIMVQPAIQPTNLVEWPEYTVKMREVEVFALIAFFFGYFFGSYRRH